jgi:anti-sigma B factor antagonist
MLINNIGPRRRPGLRGLGAPRRLAGLCPAAHRTFRPSIPPARNNPQAPAEPPVHARAVCDGPSSAPDPAAGVLELAAYARDDCTVITVVGELDIATAPSLAGALHHVPAPAPIILDLAGVTFMDCAGLHPILHAHRDAAARGTPLLLVPTTAITRLLRLTGTQHILTRPTVPDALATVTAQPHPPSNRDR